MRILVLGAAGFLGSRLVQELIKRSQAGGEKVAIVATDLRAPTKPWPESPAADLQFVPGNVLDPALFDTLFAQPVDAIYHLAATLTIDAEMDFAQGLAVNVHALMRLLERCRAQEKAPKLLFASSVSTFGGPLPDVVDDFVFQSPQTSYGTHKVIAEQLINDYSRRGYVDGRALRLPIVLTHPGPPSHSVSDRIAAMIREPLNGRAAVCPLEPATLIAVASVDRVVDAFLRLASVPADAFATSRALNMPACTLTPAQIADAVARRLPSSARQMIEWKTDPVVQRVVESWPRNFTSELALRLGITPDPSAVSIVDAYLAARG